MSSPRVIGVGGYTLTARTPDRINFRRWTGFESSPEAVDYARRLAATDFSVHRDSDGACTFSTS